MPFVIFQLLLRVFYSLHDSRTAAIVGLLTMVFSIAASVTAKSLLPAAQVVAGLAVAYGISNLVVPDSAAIGKRLSESFCNAVAVSREYNTDRAARAALESRKGIAGEACFLCRGPVLFVDPGDRLCW